MDTIIKDLLESKFGDSFQFHPAFYEEFSELVQKSGEEKRIINVLVRRLLSIIELENIDYGLKWLEHLKKYGNMYSLHIDTQRKNYRLLFSKKDDKKFFLHMFYERSGKDDTSYAKHVPIAINRRDNY